MPRQVSPAIVVVGSGLLLVSLFLKWYEPATDAWTAFELLDLVLAGAAIFAFSAAVPALRGPRWPAHGRAVPGLGAAAALIVLSQVINPPAGHPRRRWAADRGLAGPRRRDHLHRRWRARHAGPGHQLASV